MVSLRVRVNVTTTISRRIVIFLKKSSGCLLVLFHLLLAKWLSGTPRVCLPNPPVFPIKGVARVELNVSEKIFMIFSALTKLRNLLSMKTQTIVQQVKTKKN